MPHFTFYCHFYARHLLWHSQPWEKNAPFGPDKDKHLILLQPRQLKELHHLFIVPK